VSSALFESAAIGVASMGRHTIIERIETAFDPRPIF
jgi:hypothetical protein